ncbi:chymotrypsin-1-like [Phymastichus coffea]|uniref:chymotrypsin-1-like n=1 Tax=Phymastichus coffea TaxID=108790 RepID=UPI00273CCF73|nr:chymotrypsin-1-like [Phymastichus coffea]
MNTLGLVFLVGAVASVNGHVTEKERIVGGKLAEVGEFPYMVSLRMRNNHFCGGALITKRHVLTAAHCIYPMTQRPMLKPYLHVVVGTNSVTWGGKSYKVKNLSYYPEYYDQTEEPDFMYDIGIVTLAEEVKESKLVKTIALPTVNRIQGGEKAVISGWGTMKSPDTPPSEILRKLDVTIVSNAQCQRFYSRDRKIVPSHVCGLKWRGAGVCSGDSGGPLVSGGELIGVVSGGVACALGFPDVYTRVSSYLKYIHSVIDTK